VVEEIHQQVEHLGLNLHPLALAAELIEAILKLAVVEAVEHRFGWAAVWPPPPPYTTSVASSSREIYCPRTRIARFLSFCASAEPVLSTAGPEPFDPSTEFALSAVEGLIFLGRKRDDLLI